MQVDAANVSGGRTQSQPMRRDLGGPSRLASRGRLGICPGWTQRMACACVARVAVQERGALELRRGWRLGP